MKLSLGAVLLPAVVAFGAFGCAASNDDNTSSDESNLDTSGCTGIESAQTQGAIRVSAKQPPNGSCWNIESSGLTVSYSWTQKNSAQPEKNIGFYVALNGGDDFQKAGSETCQAHSGGISMGADTSGDTYYDCSATKTFNFGAFPELKSAAYDAGGHRTTWNVQVAISLDDAGNWDSQNGANYRFTF